MFSKNSYLNETMICTETVGAICRLKAAGKFTFVHVIHFSVSNKQWTQYCNRVCQWPGQWPERTQNLPTITHWREREVIYIQYVIRKNFYLIQINLTNLKSIVLGIWFQMELFQNLRFSSKIVLKILWILTVSLVVLYSLVLIQDLSLPVLLWNI